MRLVLHHPPQVIGQPAADRENREHLDEVRQRRGIFKWMRRIGIHVAATVGAQHFDGDLRGHRSLGNGLFGYRLAPRSLLCRQAFNVSPFVVFLT